MQTDDTLDRLDELKALYTMLRFAAARAEEIEADALVRAIDRARRTAYTEILLCEQMDLPGTHVSADISLLRKNN